MLKELEYPYFMKLAEKLQDAILHSRADSTVTKYLEAAFRRWKTWATQHTALPAKDYQVALYLQHLGDN